VTTGSYQYIDANGLLQTVNYVADPVNGFRVAATNLPVAPAAPAAPEVAPLVAPVFNLEGPAPVEDTAEVVAAKAEFQAAFDAAAAAAADRKKREAEPQLLGYPYATALPAALPAFAPVGAVAKSVVVKSDVITPAEVSHEVAAAPVVTYAHPYAHAFYGKRSAEAEPQVLAYGGYAGLPYAAALPAAVPALAPVGAVAHAPVVKSDVITPAEVSHEVAAAPVVTYAHPAFAYGKRSAEAEPQLLGYPYAGLPYAAALPAAVPALAPVGAVAHAPVVKSDVITPAEVSHEVAAAPVVTYAHPVIGYGKRSADEAAPAPAVVAAPTVAGLPYPYAAGLPLTYAAAPALAAAPVAYAAAAPAVAAAPSRDAVLTTIKLNPGHATFYRVD